MAGEKRPDPAPSGEGDGETEPSVGRRRLLRAGLNIGVGGALVWGSGTDYVSSDEFGTITYAMARPEPNVGTLEPRTKEVPIAWHESQRLAFEVQERIRAAGLSALVGSFIVPGSYDEPEASIAVDATDEGVAETLGDLTGDLAIDLRVVDEIPPRSGGRFELGDAYQVADLNPEHVPGGVVCTGGEMYGTLAPALFDAGSQSRFFATSNHVYGAAGTKELEHREEPLSLLHGGEPHRIGNVKRGYPAADLVQIEPVDGHRPVPEIERASPSRVIGQYTKVGLADLMARREPLTKVGALSDRTTGTIEGIDGISCYTGRACKPGQLKWGAEDTIVDGDSGSVNFHPDPEHPDDYVLVGGVNNARTWWPGADFAWGTAAHHLLEEYGLHF